MKHDYLAETWPEKFARYAIGEEYVYHYQLPKQLERAQKAVDAVNWKGKIMLVLRKAHTSFLIKCEAKKKKLIPES